MQHTYESNKVVAIADWRRRWHSEPTAQQATEIAEACVALSGVARTDGVPSWLSDAIRTIVVASPEAIRAYASLLDDALREEIGEGEGA